MTRRIYLDHAATTPVLPSVVEAMAPWVGERFGNPSSLYEEGREARQAIDESRETLASAFGCLFGEVVFTSSGTESCNLAIIGAALANDSPCDTVLFSAAEHHCVLNTMPILEKLGFRVKLVPVDSVGRIDIGALEEMADEKTLIVSAMHANNETGVYNDVQAVGEIAKKHGALFHCDAVQTFPGPTVESLNADLVSVSAHKFGGPKGVGALYIRAGTKVSPTMLGGGQEREMRAGTENVAAIVGMAEAVKVVIGDKYRQELKGAALSAFQSAFKKIESPPFIETATKKERLPGHLHGRFEGVSSESLLILLDQMGVSASAGSACSSGSVEPSHVLLAGGWGEEAREGFRLVFGPETTTSDAEEAAKRVAQAARQVAHAHSHR